VCLGSKTDSCREVSNREWGLTLQNYNSLFLETRYDVREVCVTYNSASAMNDWLCCLALTVFEPRRHQTWSDLGQVTSGCLSQITRTMHTDYVWHTPGLVSGFRNYLRTALSTPRRGIISLKLRYLLRECFRF
jgi:hypothetical protein